MTADMIALRDAILRDPADDGLRLAYADACRDAGEVERAEFVEVQLKLAKVIANRPGHNGGTSTGWRDPMREWRVAVDDLRRRERDLLAEHWPAWSYPIPTMRPHDLTFRRGFVSEVQCDWPVWRDHGDAILAEHPVEVVRLTTWPEFAGHNTPLRTNFADPKNPKSVFRLCGVVIETIPNSGPSGLLTARWPADPARPRIRFELPPEPTTWAEQMVQQYQSER